jgi:ribonuclease T2
MNTYWKDVSGDDESFWEHEWSKHGTCVSTLAPACYSGYTAKQEVGDYFQKAVDIFKTRDTYGVSPSVILFNISNTCRH